MSVLKSMCLGRRPVTEDIKSFTAPLFPMSTPGRRILVLYHSSSGNTRRAAELVAQGAFGVEGVSVETVPADMFDPDILDRMDGIALGSPDFFSYVSGEVKCFFDRVYRDTRVDGKPFVAFGTHGGGGKVVKVLERLSTSVGLVRICPGVLVKGQPGTKDEARLRDLGRALGLRLSKGSEE